MKYLALDIETVGLRPFGGTIWIITMFDGKKQTVIQNCNGVTKKDIPAIVRQQWEDPTVCKIIHNAPFDVTYIELVLGIKIRNVWDTQACEILIQGMRVTRKHKDKTLVAAHNAALENVLPRYGFKRPDKTMRENFIDRPKGKPFTRWEIQYAVDDVLGLIQIQKAQEYILTRDGMLELALLECKAAERIARMRAYGIGFDRKVWLKIAEANEKEYNLRMSKLPRRVNNWNSTQQVKAFFLDIGILIDTYKNLDDIYERSGNEILGSFIKARELHKAVTAFGKNWFTEPYIDSDGRVRCDFDQIVDTGRMSASNPNLQQLPSKGLHRSAFVSKPGYSFIIADFTGQEIGIMAAASNERIWIEAMLRGDDVHSLTASLLYADQWGRAGKRKCSFPKKCDCPGHLELREQAKVLNFMLAYGGGPEKFSQRTGLEMFDAKVIIKRYKNIIKRLTAWLAKNGETALNTGESYSASVYRRRRVLTGHEAWHVVNQGKNSPIQGAGADMLKLALISVPEKYPVALVIHDELILEVKDTAVPKALKEIKNIMEQAADYITGVKGLIKVTPRAAKNLLKK